VKSKGIAWPQVRDGKDGQIAKLFNVQGTPTYYVLDRDGKIAAKAIPSEKLSALIADLLKNSSAPTTDSDERDKWQKPDEVMKALSLKPGQVVADIGAGTGYFTRRFAAATAPTGKAIGIEIDAAMVRALVADARRWNLTNYEARLVPPDDPMLAPRSVDVIFLCDTYHHLNDRVAYFTKVRPSLKPGGQLIIIDYVKSPEHPEHSVVREEVVDELRRAGYGLAREFDLLLPKQYFLEFEPAPDQRPSNDPKSRPQEPGEVPAPLQVFSFERDSHQLSFGEETFFGPFGAPAAPSPPVSQVDQQAEGRRHPGVKRLTPGDIRE
jgi:predicted methyltransferase